ncbi:reverse transcriptase domain-containing protein [Planctomycetota bacterium]
MRQLLLPFATAANPFARRAKGATDGATMGLPVGTRRAAPKAEDKEKTAASATLEGVIERLCSAFERVASNKGAAGPDRQSIDTVRKHLDEVLRKLETDLLAGTYVPGMIRRVWISKAGGGERGLGIPNVVDRMVQETVRQVLEPLYEPTFHPNSHGFRPSRSCHTAVTEARSYVSLAARASTATTQL